MRNHALVVLVIAACGPDSGSGSIPIDGLGAAAVDAFCDIYVRCGLFPDQATCHSLYGLDIMVDADLVAAVKAGKVIYHGDKARVCFDEFTATTCERSEVFSSRNQPLACDQTFEGTVGDAGACALNEECISRVCSIPSCPSNTCCMGTCVGGTAPVRADLGQACSSTVRCNTGYCDTTTNVCTAFLADGAPCTSSQSCSSNVCSTTCQALVAANGACVNGTQCRDIGDTCNSGSKTCVPYGNLGDTCAVSLDCSTIYACDTATLKCVARPKLGDACSTVSTCIDHSYCESTTMTCTALKADGAACTSTTECESKHCDTATTHTCVTPPVCI